MVLEASGTLKQFQEGVEPSGTFKKIFSGI